MTTVLLALVNTTYGQVDSIFVSSACGESVSVGYYINNGLVNGKPQFKKGVIDCMEYTNEPDCGQSSLTPSYFVEWNGTSWIWIKRPHDCYWLFDNCVPLSQGDPDPTTPIVLASSNLDTPFPPCTGWISLANNCLPTIGLGCSCRITDKAINSSVNICDSANVLLSRSKAH
ncbi:MAG: hypothetical protein HY062_17050 [Bacteroidetes bacterium]|nr:hypothetical protein [Bacteroidota bacterium]